MHLFGGITVGRYRLLKRGARMRYALLAAVLTSILIVVELCAHSAHLYKKYVSPREKPKLLNWPEIRARVRARHEAARTEFVEPEV